MSNIKKRNSSEESNDNNQIDSSFHNESPTKKSKVDDDVHQTQVKHAISEENKGYFPSVDVSKLSDDKFNITRLGDLLAVHSDQLLPFDKELIDDSLIKKETVPQHLKNQSAINQKMKKILKSEKCRKLAMALVYYYIVSEHGCDLQEIRYLKSKNRTSVNNEILYNIMAGKTQSGKTRTLAAITYVTAICTNRIPILNVKSGGGSESMLHLKRAIENLQSDCIEYLEDASNKEEFSDLLEMDDEKLKQMFTIRIIESNKFSEVYERDVEGKGFSKGEKELELGNMKVGGIALLGRLNNATLDKIFNSGNSRARKARKSAFAFHKVLEKYQEKRGESNQLYRIAFISDEDDVNVSSFDRCRTKTELAMYATPDHKKKQTNDDSEEEDETDETDEE